MKVQLLLHGLRRVTHSCEAHAIGANLLSQQLLMQAANYCRADIQLCEVCLQSCCRNQAQEDAGKLQTALTDKSAALEQLAGDLAKAQADR